MGRQQKIAPEEKDRLLQRLRQGEISQAQAAEEAGVWKVTIQKWLARYETEGIEGFLPYEKNRQYSAEIKLEAVLSYLGGEGSLLEICKNTRYDQRPNYQVGFSAFFICVLYS